MNYNDLLYGYVCNLRSSPSGNVMISMVVTLTGKGVLAESIRGVSRILGAGMRSLKPR